MNEEEKRLLLVIDNLQTQLLEEGNNCNGYAYRRIAHLLFDKVLELFNKFSPNYLTISNIERLGQTVSEEGERIVAKYEEVRKPNSSQVRKIELMSKINSANSTISMDIFSVFQKINEIKAIYNN